MLKNSSTLVFEDLPLLILRIVRVSTCLIMMTNFCNFVKYDNERSRMLMRLNTGSLASNKTTNYLTERLIVFPFSIVQFLHTQTQRVNWKRENYRRTLF